MFAQLADQFGALWDSGDAAPDVFAFLQQHAHHDKSEKLFVLLHDQQRRWRTDHPLRVEEYLDRLPELATDPQIKLELAVGEFQALQRSGTFPDIEQFTSRFSDVSDALSSKLSDIVGLLEDAGECPELATTKSFVASSALGPDRVGRYRLLSVLGEGAFGRVYLGFDEELHRYVAIKVPTAKQYQKPRNTAAYLVEARTVANLDHPNIVPVHDLGRLENGSIYVVSKFIEGRSLKDLQRARQVGFEEATQLVATIARALHHAHEKRLVHRDVKPGNILIDESTGTPYISDFGLAIREELYVPDCTITGTPAYMSPEQARGEGHRLDGRSDIFSLGVVYYELLTGEKPFRGSTNSEVLHAVIAVNPIEPRQIDDSIPAALERICLKAIAKRATDRYPTAAALADDLLQWQQAQQQPSEVKIVPQGLRSFDADDADYFLELLPGPRGRDDLPESIRFWKTRIEESDPDGTFSVGLILGPSGCGKTSLVRAGLLPRLSNHVTSVYVEADPAETEYRILRAIRKGLPKPLHNLGLAETFSRLRRRENGKTLLVLDQFEQWLYTKIPQQQNELVGALRQCDGATLQAILMVRDDFAMAAARFMDQLEIPIRQGHNFATVDFFGVDHAQKVLIKFGQAFDKLPERAGNLSDGQKEFVRQVSSGLARDGKVVSVRLSLFAEMIKNKPWVPATLEEVGGTEGIGVNFLEETFNSRSANPDHRRHQQAAREVLKALLPEVGTDIKGHMRSQGDLLEASGYEKRPADFNHLIRILDAELRLITPTDSESYQGGQASDSNSKYFQLTHDYLVPVLREWITRKQRETRRGRAELRLAERAAIWNLRPERRHLPSLWEYLRIVGFTSRQNRTPAERRMMDAAARVHGLRSIAAFLVIGAILAGLVFARKRFVDSQHLAAVDQLLVADISEVPGIVAALETDSDEIDRRLTAVADNPGRSEGERLRATIALANGQNRRAPQLIKFAAAADLAAITAIHDRIAPFAQDLKDELWQAIERDAMPLPARLRIGTLLALADPEGSRWENAAKPVVEGLLAENTLDLDSWVELLRPASRSLIPVLNDRFSDASATSADRVTSARALARYADAELLSELLLNADPSQFSILIPGTLRNRSKVVAAMTAVLRQPSQASISDDPLRHARQLRNAGITLIRLNQPRNQPRVVETFLSSPTDPTARTMVILEVRDFGISPSTLIDVLRQLQDPSARQAILLALEPYLGQEMSPGTKPALVDLIMETFRNGKYQAERSAAEWLLRKSGRAEEIERINGELARPAPPSIESLGDHDWWVTTEGHTMRVVRGPIAFKRTPPTVKPDPKPDGDLVGATIAYNFAVSVHEVTMQQYLRFKSDAEFSEPYTHAPNCAANGLTFAQATQYCRWLSIKEGIPDDQLCYGTDGAAPNDASIAHDQLLRTGYRLPTDVEWECVCRAGSITPWFFGNDEQHLTQFAWFATNTDQVVQPIGLLRPNPWGFFDISGNVGEWCHTSLTDDDKRFVLRGGRYHDPPRSIRSGVPYFQSQKGYSYTGLRIARTLPPVP